MSKEVHEIHNLRDFIGRQFLNLFDQLFFLHGFVFGATDAKYELTSVRFPIAVEHFRLDTYCLGLGALLRLNSSGWAFWRSVFFVVQKSASASTNFSGYSAGGRCP